MFRGCKPLALQSQLGYAIVPNTQNGGVNLWFDKLQFVLNPVRVDNLKSLSEAPDGMSINEHSRRAQKKRPRESREARLCLRQHSSHLSRNG
jgi:hypothetical protein